MPRKNIENKLRAIDNPAFGVFLDVALLNGREIAIENNQWGVFGIGFGENFVEFAAADERGGIGFVAQLENGAGDRSARAAGELDQFDQRFAFRSAGWAAGNARRALPGYADEKRAFSGGDSLRGFHRSQDREVRAMAATTKGRNSIQASIRRRSALQVMSAEFSLLWQTTHRALIFSSR